MRMVGGGGRVTSVPPPCSRNRWFASAVVIAAHQRVRVQEFVDLDAQRAGALAVNQRHQFQSATRPPPPDSCRFRESLRRRTCRADRADRTRMRGVRLKFISTRAVRVFRPGRANNRFASTVSRAPPISTSTRLPPFCNATIVADAVQVFDLRRGRRSWASLQRRCARGFSGSSTFSASRARLLHFLAHVADRFARGLHRLPCWRSACLIVADRRFHVAPGAGDHRVGLGHGPGLGFGLHLLQFLGTLLV